jgi:hypothetical protein
MEAVRVIYHHEADGWWAESPDIEGWSAAGDTYAKVVKLAEEGLPFAWSDPPCKPRSSGQVVTQREKPRRS